MCVENDSVCDYSSWINQVGWAKAQPRLGTILQISLLLLTFVGLLAWFYWKFIRQAVPSAPIVRLDSIDKRWILGLSAVYALISFIHFADTREYINPWHGTQGNQLIITLHTPIPLSVLYYSSGYVKGNYSLHAMSATAKTIPLKNEGAGKVYSPYFRWNTIKFDGKTPIASIIVDIDAGPVDITQFAVVDNHHRLISNVNVSDNASQNGVLNRLISKTLPEHVDNIFLSSAVFDEIYYATSAYEYLHGLAPTVWVHPQLGIYLIELGILIFGMSPLGWRIMPDLASICMVPLLYLFAKRMFKQRVTAIAATILIMTEFMHFTLGRSASLEPFVTLFLILEYYFLYDYVDRRVHGATFNSTFKSLLYGAIFFGLALSCKWSALYSVPVILWVMVYAELIHNREPFLITRVVNLAALFIILPLLIYLVTYIPYVWIHHSTNLVPFVYQTQKDILNFHLYGQIHATHPYASSWWTWPFDLMPLSMYYWQDAKGYMSASLALLGNPALCWLTWGVIAFLAYQWFLDRRNIIAAFLFLAIVSQYLSYAFISRISFIYYFYSVTPFLILGVCYVLNQLWQSGNTPRVLMAYSYLTLSILLFLLFFTALAGMDVPRDYTAHILKWMKGWNF